MITESLAPEKRSKVELEQIIKVNGGRIFQSEKAEKGVICIGERRTVKVASLQKGGVHSIVRPKWIFDCIAQSRADIGLPEYLIPLEPQHLFFASEENPIETSENVDEYSDSFARNITIAELKNILGTMKIKSSDRKSGIDLKDKLLGRDQDLESLPGWMFKDFIFYFDELQDKQCNGHGPTPDNTVLPHLRAKMASNTARFAGGSVSDSLKDQSITHVVVGTFSNVQMIRDALKWYT